MIDLYHTIRSGFRKANDNQGEDEKDKKKESLLPDDAYFYLLPP
jgi:hypothetical protein